MALEEKIDIKEIFEHISINFNEISENHLECKLVTIYFTKCIVDKLYIGRKEGQPIGKDNKIESIYDIFKDESTESKEYTINDANYPTTLEFDYKYTAKNIHFKNLVIYIDTANINISFINCISSITKQTKPKNYIILDRIKAETIDFNNFEIGSFTSMNSNINNFYIQNCDIISYYNTSDIQNLIIEDSNIDEITLRGNIKECVIASDKENLINNMFFGAKESQTCIISYNITNLEISDLIEDTNFRCKLCHIKKILIENINTKKGSIRINESNIPNFEIENASIPKLQMINCDFSKSHFTISNSFINELLWTNVKWAKELKYYCANYVKPLSLAQNTLLLLKQQANKLMNKTQEFEFLALEMKAIKENNSFKWHNKLKQNKNKWISIISWSINPVIDFIEIINKSYSSSEDKVIFFLGRYTNNFGLSWFRPLAIYLISSYLVFIGITDYELTTSWKFDVINTPLFSDFLIPKFDKKSRIGLRYENTALLNAIFLLTKVFQGFLIYQFIRTFRRFYTK